MHSESARMSSAAEAKFRIDQPNSQPRAVKVIALDAPERAHRQGARAIPMAARHLSYGLFVFRRTAEGRALFRGWLA